MYCTLFIFIFFRLLCIWFAFNFWRLAISSFSRKCHRIDIKYSVFTIQYRHYILHITTLYLYVYRRYPCRATKKRKNQKKRKKNCRLQIGGNQQKSEERLEYNIHKKSSTRTTPNDDNIDKILLTKRQSREREHFSFTVAATALAVLCFFSAELMLCCRHFCSCMLPNSFLFLLSLCSSVIICFAVLSICYSVFIDLYAIAVVIIVLCV